MHVSRIGISLALAALLLSGCDSEKFDPATQYSAESLASELIFRCKDLPPSSPSRKPSEPATPPKNLPKNAAKANEKARDVGKAALSITLDDLIDEVAAKANLVPGKTRPETLKTIVEIVSKDTTLPSADKQKISEKLGKMATGG